MFEQNHTPLTYTPLNVRSYPKKITNPHTLLNIALFFSLGIFTIASGLFIQSNVNTSNGYAEETTTKPQEITIKRSIIDTYNTEPILPAHKNLLIAVHDKEVEFAQRESIIKKYYIYKDIVTRTGNDPTATLSANTLLEIQSATLLLEPLVIADRLHTREVAYIYAYTYDPSFTTEQNSTRDVEGRLILAEYKKLFDNKTYSLSQIINIAQEDEKLAQYKFQESPAGIITNYYKGFSLFSQDTTIDDTVFSLEPNTLSPITAIKDSVKGNALGYVLFYVISENIGNEVSLETVLQDSDKLFTYK